jgi:diaminohydroxyphosphoribosylaminopyrimidine deaminase/5-amino-6-(5-phosphoribosylamino)uracil reductase
VHDENERFIRRALEEARKGLGSVSPNPAVGAVLVRRGRVIATGYHRGRGLPHAEIDCLSAAPAGSHKSATLFVTLEPCCTTGRTPPCTTAIVQAGIKRVVIGAMDPNPLHSGRGIEQLKDAGIEVMHGVLQDECSQLNEAFNKWIVTRRPFVIAKCGMSLDGRLTRPPNEKRWLTSQLARVEAMKLRSQVDAILIGANTLREDNPRLTVRGVGRTKQPWRIVLTRQNKLPGSAHLFTDRFADRTRVYKGKSLSKVLDHLGSREITSVLIEGGSDVLGQAFDQRLVDKVHFFLAPILTGGPFPAVGGKGAGSTTEGARIVEQKLQQVGPDLLVVGYPKWNREGVE